MYCSYLNLSRLPIPVFPSFEAIAASFKISSSSFTILNIYRPPDLSFPLFLSEFAHLLESLVPSKSELIITGDFNIHMDQQLDLHTISFNTLLSTFDLSQHVNFKTHTAGHTLDLFITRSNSTLAPSVDWIIPFMSDHYAIIASLSIPTTARPPLIKKTFRTLSKIHLPSFRHDLVNSSIFLDPQTTLLTLNAQIHDCLIALLDKHAPLIIKSCPNRQTKPFITPAILAAKNSVLILKPYTAAPNYLLTILPSKNKLLSSLNLSPLKKIPSFETKYPKIKTHHVVSVPL